LQKILRHHLHGQFSFLDQIDGSENNMPEWILRSDVINI